ncbi:hypothetical protein ABJ384_07740 [Acinetobacter sp. A1-4-2]|uniref:Uncharacterized protein n=1 Tax=Acinetobacter sp. A1-4-2 TaxID=3156489 RepID=A0AAU7STT6_9GAMM
MSSVLTKDELQLFLTMVMRENEELKEENRKLLLIVADSTEQIKKATYITEEYQRMFNEITEALRTRYAAEFTVVEDIPKYLS